MPRVFLVGFMGAGKTSVGAALANRLGYRFFDLDEQIRLQFGTPIPRIFEDHGEAAFRATERDQLAHWAGHDDVVVATGGGAFCSAENRDIIRRAAGVTVFLDLPWDELEGRLASDHAGRPKYDDAGQARRLFEERLPDYLSATVRVKVDGSQTPSEVAARIEGALREASCAT